jgi:hypothetical protein
MKLTIDLPKIPEEQKSELDEKAKIVLRGMKNVSILFGADDQLVKPLCGQEIFDFVGEPKEFYHITS